MTESDCPALDVWLEKYEQVLREKPSGEAERARHKQKIARLDRQLDPAVARKSPRALRAKATLARKRHRFDEAIRFWQDYANLVPKKKADLALLKIADIHLLNGEAAEAERVLNTVSDKEHSLFRKIQERLWTGRRYKQASTTYNDALGYFSQGRLTEFEQSVLSALRLLYGNDLPSHPQLLALIRELASAQAGNLPEIAMPHKGPSSDGPVAIFVAGFGWSGSGAAFDFLRQHQDAETFSKEELTILASREGDVVKCLDVLQREPKQFQNTFCATILHGILGLSTRSNQGEKIIKKARARSLISVFIDDKEKIQSLLLATQKLVRTALQIDTEDVDRHTLFSAAFAEFFRIVLKLKQGGTRYLLFNNAITGRYIEAIRLMPENSIAIAVVRDVRDIYCDRFFAGRCAEAQKFVNAYRSKRRLYEEALAHPDVGPKVIEIWFENLILDPDFRQDLLVHLGMNPARSDDGSKSFDPEKSRKNIGMYSAFSDQAAIAVIEDALPLFLYKRK